MRNDLFKLLDSDFDQMKFERKFTVLLSMLSLKHTNKTVSKFYLNDLFLARHEILMSPISERINKLFTQDTGNIR
jgi:hypothetical protein